MARRYSFRACRRAAVVIGALALSGPTSGPSAAAAAEPPSGEQGSSQARALELFEQSETLYREGKFAEAAALLEQAHELHSEPTLLYNLARAREGEGKLAAAADAYERYLQGSTEARDRGAIEQRIRSLREREQERIRLQQEQREAKERLAQMEREKAEQPPSEDDGGVLDGPLPWVLFGVGVAGVGVGLGLGAAAQSKQDDAAEEPVQLDAVDKQRSAEDLATGANIAIVAGAAVAAIGGVLGVIGLASSGTEEEPPTAAWQLRVGPTFLGIDGRF